MSKGGLHAAQSAPATSPSENPVGGRAIHVFLDGSGIDGQVEAAVVQDMRVLRSHLGALSEHTVFEVEALGVLLAFHLLELEDPMTRQS